MHKGVQFEAEHDHKGVVRDGADVHEVCHGVEDRPHIGEHIVTKCGSLGEGRGPLLETHAGIGDPVEEGENHGTHRPHRDAQVIVGGIRHGKKQIDPQKMR